MSSQAKPASEEDEFDIVTINKTLDLSNHEYPALLERQRRLEVERTEREKAERNARSIWQKVVDSLVPL